MPAVPPKLPSIWKGVDVDVVVGVPRGGDAVVPDALQVGGKAAGPGGRDEHVASELEVERNEGGVVAGRDAVLFVSRLELGEAFVGRGGGGVPAAEVEPAAVEEALVFRNV